MLNEKRKSIKRDAIKLAEPIITNTKRRRGFCSYHPLKETSWRCQDCNEEFCEDCVTPIRHSMSYLAHFTPFAKCPKCEGTCFDFQHAGRLVLARNIAKKKMVRKLLLAGVVLTLIFTMFLIWAPFEIQMIFFLILFAVMNVLRSQRFLDDLIGGDSIFTGLSAEIPFFESESRTPSKTFLFVVSLIAITFIWLMTTK